MASRIYNEKPQTDGVPSFRAAPPTPPAPPSMQSVPEGIPQHMGSLPFSVNSIPHAAPFSPGPSAASADAPQPPQFGHWPSAAVPTESTPKAFSPSGHEG